MIWSSRLVPLTQFGWWCLPPLQSQVAASYHSHSCPVSAWQGRHLSLPACVSKSEQRHLWELLGRTIRLEAAVSVHVLHTVDVRLTEGKAPICCFSFLDGILLRHDSWSVVRQMKKKYTSKAIVYKSIALCHSQALPPVTFTSRHEVEARQGSERES